MRTITTFIVIFLLFGIQVPAQIEKGMKEKFAKFEKETKSILEKENKLKGKDFVYIPLDINFARDMRNAFLKYTLPVLDKEGVLRTDTFTLGNQQWRELCDFLQNNSEVTIIRLYFLQFFQNDFKSKYTELAPFDGKLYLGIGFFDHSKNLVSGKYYGMLSVGKTVEIEPQDFIKMHNNYLDNIRSKINNLSTSGENTKYLKIDVEDFEVQRKIIEVYNSTMSPKNMHSLTFTLAQAIDPVSPTPFYSSKYIKSQGQLTALTDAIDNNGNVIDHLKNYDMNSLCPEQCP
ncbi:hypothetical protein [uncultured Chryseobacterium sp.]|uniref:hypothetical protein n=1 Tax=uncultured Chryseobacterium sp. TaxID=259322 RepID=UPI0025F8FF90|nr:hypothetical protein [uncultured Chryseobacterium sp.]